MRTTSLRKVGGSVMLALPPAFLDQLQLQVGATVGLTIADGCLVIDPTYSPQTKPRYSLAELLATSDYTQTQQSSEREWVDAEPVGGELI